MSFNLSEHKNVFFVGIGGVSMSALALILRTKGMKVRGFDRSHSHETEILESKGVEITYSETEFDLSGIDLVVYTAAVNTSHPIVAKALEFGIECIVRGVLLGAISDLYEISIGVAGTHGKSTTSGMISAIFNHTEGRDPSFAVGALLPFVNAYYKVGSDNTFIYEADEYKDSFLNFKPTTAVVLNVYHDHPDYFKNENQVISSFIKYISHSECAVLNYDCENAVTVSKGFNGKKVFFSMEEKTDYYASDIDMSSGYGVYTLNYPGGSIKIKLSVPGIHNVANSLAAFVACHINGLKPKQIADGIYAFGGVSRRYEKIGEINGASVISDYAHHPDEITACLRTARTVTKGKVCVVFQPHTYSRLKGLFDGFVESLKLADEIAVTDVFSARETDTCGMSGELLASNVGGVYVSSFEAGADFVIKNSLPGNTVILMGAGDIYKVWDILQKNS